MRQREIEINPNGFISNNKKAGGKLGALLSVEASMRALKQGGRASLRLPCYPLLTPPGNRTASSRPLLSAGDPTTRIKDTTELTMQTKKRARNQDM